MDTALKTPTQPLDLAREAVRTQTPLPLDAARALIAFADALHHDALAGLLSPKSTAATLIKTLSLFDKPLLFAPDGSPRLLRERIFLLLFIIATSRRHDLKKHSARMATTLHEHHAWSQDDALAQMAFGILKPAQHEELEELVALRNQLAKHTGHRHTSLGVLHEDHWSSWEKSIFKQACAIHEGESQDSDHFIADALLCVLAMLHERNHSPRAERLRKSGQLSPLIRLLDSPRLYPAHHEQAHALKARVRLLLDVALDSPQRPVIEAAAMVCLERELEQRWSRHFPSLATRAVHTAEHTREVVLPLIALLHELNPQDAAAQFERLRTSRFEDRRMRLVELVTMFDVYTDSPSLPILTAHTYEAIFDALPTPKKLELAERLMREIERRGLGERQDTWELLLDPMLMQNRRNLALQRQLADLAIQAPLIEAEPYVLFYLDASLEQRRPGALTTYMDWIREHGSREFIPRLYPLTEQKSSVLLLLRPSSLALKAKAVVDAIIEREGLGDAQGGLSVSEAGAGRLSLARATQGALSVSQDTDLAPAYHDDGALEHALALHPALVALAVLAVLALLGLPLLWMLELL